MKLLTLNLIPTDSSTLNTMHTMKTILSILSLTAALVMSAWAQPSYLNYQGKLTDANGVALVNASYLVEFNIYDQATGGTRVWGPFLCDGGTGNGHAPKAAVVGGRFNVVLGERDTIDRMLSDAFRGAIRFVEIKVAGGAPIDPRQQVLSAAYAFNSSYAAGMSLVGDDTIKPNGKIGIGTQSPQDQLQIGDYSSSANQYLSIKSSGGNEFQTGIKFRHFDDSLGFNIEDDERGGMDGLNFIRYPFGAPTSAMFIDRYNGNVGIGTSTPANPAQASRVLNIAGNNSGSFPGTAAIVYSSPVNNQTWSAGTTTDGSFRFFKYGGGSSTVVVPVLQSVSTVGVGATTVNGEEIDSSGSALWLNRRSAEDVNVGYGGGDIHLGDGDSRVSINKSYPDVTFTARKKSGDEYGALFEWADGENAVGIAKSGDDDYALKVWGKATRDNGNTSWDALSDRRFKTNIHSLHAALEMLDRVRPVRFQYNAKYRSENPRVLETEQFGVIAQEFAGVFPDFVSTNAAGYLTVNTSPLVFFAAAAIQELHQLVRKKDAQITALEQKADKVAGLEKENVAMQKEIVALQKQVASQQQASTQWEARFSALEKVVAKAGPATGGSRDRASLSQAD